MSRVDRDRAAQAIDRQALDEVVRGLGLAIEQQVVAIGPDEEIERGICPAGVSRPAHTGKVAADVAGHQALEEFAHAFAREADDGAVGEGGGGHGH